MQTDIEHSRLATGELDLHVAMSGPAEGPPLLFMHGFPEFWYGWRDQLTYFAEAGYRVIAPDQRGCGDSDKPAAVSAYHIDRLAADMVGVIDALGYDQVDLVAHDWGGIATWRLLESQAERVGRVVIMNAPHLSDWRHRMLRSPRQMAKSWYVLAFQLPWLPEKINGLGGGSALLGLSGLAAVLDGESRAHYRRAYAKGLPTMMHCYRAAMRDARQAARPPATPISNKLLLLWGREDRFLNPELARDALELCSDARLQFIDPAGHWLAHEQPEVVNQAIHAFFKEA